LPGVAPAGAQPFQKGQAPNPTGKGGDYHVAQQICRQATPEAACVMVELLKSDDDRVRLMAADKIYERAFGKPKDFDPEKEGDGGIDLNKMSDEDLAALVGILCRSVPLPAIESPPVEDEGEVIDNKK
jgi:hypothetical protein